MRQVKGLPKADAHRVADAARAHGPLRSIDAAWRRSGASVRAMRCLARADAFDSLGLDRQAALWAVRNLCDDPMPLFDAPKDEAPEETLGKEMLPPLGPPEQTLHDYQFTGLSLKEHPIAFLRNRLKQRGVTPMGDLRDERRFPTGKRVRLGGLVLVRQRPGTASGVVFVTLEDETGIANLVIWSDTYEKWRQVVSLSGSLMVEGRIERDGEVIHVHAQRFRSLDEAMPEMPSLARNFH